MAIEESLVSVTLPAGQDLSSYQYCFVRVNSSGQVVIADATYQHCIGVLQNKPDASGKAATVGVYGVSKFLGAGTVNLGDEVSAVPATGRGAAVTTDTAVMGVCVKAAGAGTIGSVLLVRR